jgi:hypothetical protein
MKQILKAFLIFSAAATFLFAPSCQTACDSGYEGKRCDVPWRNKFIGIWNATDVSGGVSINYTDTITGGNEVTDVFLSKDFSQNRFLKFLRATINNNTINIANQKPSVPQIYVEGTGTLSSDGRTINWTYKIIDKTVSPQVETIYSAVWIKQ